jgi:hypothetical protein
MRITTLPLLLIVGLSCENSSVPPSVNVTPAQPAKLEERQERAVRSAGLREAKSTGMPLFECSDSDSMLNSEGFEAKNMAGDIVKGTVCCGWLKGCTVRFE